MAVERDGPPAAASRREGGRAAIRLTVYSDAVEHGGAEECLGNLLAALGAHVDVSVLGVDERVAQHLAARRPGTPITVVPPVRDKRDVGAIVAHLRAVRALRPHIFHANLRTTWSCQYGIAAALLVRGVRVVAVEHLPLPVDDPRQRRLKRFLAPRLASRVAVGERVARMVEAEVGLPRGSVQPIRNGVPDLKLEPMKRPAPGPIVGSLGRLHPQKGYELLVRALPDLPGVTAVLVGDGQERGRLEALAASLGVGDRLLVTGWVSYTEARRYLETFDVFVLPSLYEGLPLAILEAMMAGVPVVASDVGSVAEAVVPGETGVLVPPGDEDALARGLRELVEDEGLRARLGVESRARALRGFSLEAMASAYEALYAEVLRR